MSAAGPRDYCKLLRRAIFLAEKIQSTLDNPHSTLNGIILCNDEVVVTPSGHICIKRLLLAKLAENGGLDPFETARDLPLSLDQLVTLRANHHPRASSGIPPRPQATSLPGMLGLIQKEYDALVLELFDTRKALEETRRELSQALYQNDAAIRVVARVAQERDAARQQLEQWNASASASASATANATANAAASDEPEATVAAPPSTGGGAAAASEEQPSAKRRRILEPTATILENDLPEDDLRAMNDVWTQLNKVRKPTLKAAAASAPSPQNLADCAFLETKAWHKSTNRGILAIASGENNLTVTAGKDKQLVVYNEVDKVVQHTFAFGSVPTCVDIGKTVVVAGNAKGIIALFALDGDGTKAEIDAGAEVVDVRVHPTDQHICAATADGRLIVAYWLAEEQRLQQIATFRTKDDADNNNNNNNEGYTAACLHPDGLIYVAGTKTGKIHVWDFKNKKLAATLQDGDESDGITAIAFSNNGYHIAAGHDSATVRFWDLRKLKVAASIKCEEGEHSVSLKSIRSVAFDKAGKYAAMGGEGGVKITTVKEWGVTGSFQTKHPISGIVWSSSNSTSLLEVSCDGERAVQLYGVPPSDAKM
eukprot:jgi/Psemu1/322623/estExt_fgenesh1_pg.C_350005